MSRQGWESGFFFCLFDLDYLGKNYNATISGCKNNLQYEDEEYVLHLQQLADPIIYLFQQLHLNGP